MAQKREVFLGCEIVTDGEKLAIDGVDVDVTKAELGKYVTSYMPYTDYESVLDLAHAVVKHAPDFHSDPHA